MRLVLFPLAIVFRHLRHRFPEIRDRNVWVVFQTILVLSIAYGLAIAVLPLALFRRGFHEHDLGILATWFGFGIVSFALPASVILKKASARRTLAFSVAGYALMIGIFPFLSRFGLLAVDRGLDGACSVAAWVSCETLLLLRTDDHDKAFATSLYAIATGIGYVIGPLVAWSIVGIIHPSGTFLVAAVIAMGASAVAWFRLDPDPEAKPREHVPGERIEDSLQKGWFGLAWEIKTSAAATFSNGFFQSASVLFLPKYMIDSKHVRDEQTIFVVAASVAGMLVISNFAGRAGDRYGHLFVMRILAVVGVASIVLFVASSGLAVLLLLLFVGGGALASIPPLSLALQGLIVDPRDYMRSNSVFNVFFASGLLLGPVITAHVYLHWHGAVICYMFAALWGLFIVMSLVFARDDPHARGMLAAR